MAAADQIAGAVERASLATEATEAEIARQSDALKSALLDSVSHDLRTPLVAIRVAAGHLADPAVEMPPDAIRATGRSIEGEAARLDRLVTNVLDLSRIEAGALRPAVDPYDLADLVTQVVDRLAPTLARDAVRLDLPPDLPPVLVDPILADQILTNLLENAVAHAGPDRVVRIAAATVHDLAAVELLVEDSGPGVPPREIPHLFEKFYRGSGRRQGGRGMGIGLAVVRGLAEAMGGRVEARRELARRPRHRRRAPRRRRAGGAVTGPGRAVSGSGAAPAPGAAVLLVEDDGAARSAVATTLAARGFRVAEAADGRSALRLWESSRPDLVLLDLGLPDIDGMAVIVRIRREAATPIIVLSARGQEKDRVAALDAGADDYLTKPFGAAELHSRIRAVLRRAAGPDADQSGVLRVGPVRLDVAHRSVQVAGSTLDLTPREYELLKVLLAHAGRVVTSGHLLRAVWGSAYTEESHYIHVYVSRLRRKLAAADPTGVAGRIIVNEPGVGYRVVPPAAEERA